MKTTTQIAETAGNKELLELKKTLTKILDHHTHALKKIEQFETTGEDIEAGSDAEEMQSQSEDEDIEELTLGKKMIRLLAKGKIAIEDYL